MVAILTQAHASVMILSCLVFTSTGILFARYGRSLRFGTRRQLFGKAVWFQIHRFLLSITHLLVLLGFLLILAQAGGKWVDPRTADARLFAHSIFGGIIVCCVVIQIWLALYRCHPQSRFRFIFDWSHRIVGLTTLVLFFPTMFLIASYMSKSRPNLLPVFASWSGWIVSVVIIFELIQYRQRKAATTAAVVAANNVQVGDVNQNVDRNVRNDTEAGTNINAGSRRYNMMKLLLLFVHIIVSITCAILLITFICQ